MKKNILLFQSAMIKKTGKYLETIRIAFKKKENILLLLLSMLSIFFIYKLILFIIAYDINNDVDEFYFYMSTCLQYYHKTLYLPSNIPPFFTLYYPPVYFILNVFFVKLLCIDVNSFNGIMNAYYIGRSISFLSLLAAAYFFYKMLKINNIHNKYAVSGALIFLLFQPHMAATYRPDALRMLFLILHFYLFVKYILKDKASYLVASSIFLLIASLIKQDAVIFFMPSVMFLLIIKRFRHLIMYSLIILLYSIGGIIIYFKMPVFSDSIANAAPEGFSFYLFKYMTFPYLTMIAPMLGFSAYIFIKRSIKSKQLHLFLFLNYIMSFFILLLLTLRSKGAFHYLLPFESIMLFTILYYVFKNDILSGAKTKILTASLLYLAFLIFFKNNTVPVSLSVLTKAPKNNKESLLKAYKTTTFIISLLNRDGKHYYISYDRKLMAFSRGKEAAEDGTLNLKYFYENKYASHIVPGNDECERRRKYIVSYIQKGEIPYVVFPSSAKNDLFVDLMYPHYYLFCHYMGYDIYKYTMSYEL